MPVVIRRAVAADSAALSALASRIYYDTFAAFTAPDDMKAFLEGTYNEPQLRGEIEDPAIATIVADDEGRLAAYAQIRAGEPPPSITGPAPIELWRFYVDRPYHGRGVAQQLMAAVEEIARERNARTMWLGVWERNHRAQAFYAKYGFRRVGEHDFIVGADVQTDWLLERALQ